ncbi:MAG: hypothetical protein ACR2P7_09215 [bacterium]
MIRARTVVVVFVVVGKRDIAVPRRGKWVNIAAWMRAPHSSATAAGRDAGSGERACQALAPKVGWLCSIGLCLIEPCWFEAMLIVSPRSARRGWV